MFQLEYAHTWDQYYSQLDYSEQQKIQKKIHRLKQAIKARHLKHGLPFFVVEIGQYRICFVEEGKTRRIHFAGNHKQYEKWYKGQET